jgi:hypothetical protein
MDTWANYLKQAVVSVESTLDSILENEETTKTIKQPEGDTTFANKLKASKAQTDQSNQIKSQIKNVSSLNSDLNLHNLISLEACTGTLEIELPVEIKVEEKTQIVAESTKIAVEPTQNDWMGDDELDFGPGSQNELVTNDIEQIVAVENGKVVEPIPEPIITDEIKTNLIGDGIQVSNEKSLAASHITVPVEELKSSKVLPIKVSETQALVESNTKESDNIVPIEKEPRKSNAKTENSDFVRILEQREQELTITKTENSRMMNELELNSEKMLKLESEFKLEIQKREELERKLVLFSRRSSASVDVVQVERLTKALSEKEVSISGLLQEGESLAKEILKCNNNIKKYKKDKEQATKELAEKQKLIEILNQKTAQLTKQLQTTVESEKAIKDSQSRMNDKDSYQQKKIAELENAMLKLKQENSDLKGVANSFESQIREIEERSNQENLQAQSAALEEQLSSNAALQSQLTSAKQITHDLQITIQKIVL